MSDVDRELERLLQQSLDLIRQPNPVIHLTPVEATDRAMYLRLQGLPYTSVAKVMGVYHGLWYADTKWRKLCREAGAPARTCRDGSPIVTPQMRRAA